jgi:hypothetical protein
VRAVAPVERARQQVKFVSGNGVPTSNLWNVQDEKEMKQHRNNVGQRDTPYIQECIYSGEERSKIIMWKQWNPGPLPMGGSGLAP